MITARSKGFQVLDNNIGTLRLFIDGFLSRAKGSDWKERFGTRSGKYYPKFVETHSIDYNLIPALVHDYNRTFNEFIPVGEEGQLHILFSKVRDGRNAIAHHSDFSEASLKSLVESLRRAFKTLGLGQKFIDLNSDNVKSSHTLIQRSSIAKPYMPSNPEEEIKDAWNSLDDENADTWEKHNYFVISESKRGLGITICVEFKTGAHQGRRFVYSHDLVYDVCISHLETLESWKKYRINTSSTSIRKEARKFVKEV